MSRLSITEALLPETSNQGASASRISVSITSHPDLVRTPVSVGERGNVIAELLALKKKQKEVETLFPHGPETQKNARDCVAIIEKLQTAVRPNGIFDSKTDLRDIRSAIDILLRVAPNNLSVFFERLQSWDCGQDQALITILSNFFTASEGSQQTVGIAPEAGRVLQQIAKLFRDISSNPTPQIGAAFQTALESLRMVVNRQLEPVEHKDASTNGSRRDQYWREQAQIDQQVSQEPASITNSANQKQIEEALKKLNEQ